MMESAQIQNSALLTSIYLHSLKLQGRCTLTNIPVNVPVHKKGHQYKRAHAAYGLVINSSPFTLTLCALPPAEDCTHLIASAEKLNTESLASRTL